MSETKKQGDNSKSQPPAPETELLQLQIDTLAAELEELKKLVTSRNSVKEETPKSESLQGLEVESDGKKYRVKYHGRFNVGNSKVINIDDYVNNPKGLAWLIEQYPGQFELINNPT